MSSTSTDGRHTNEKQKFAYQAGSNGRATVTTDIVTLRYALTVKVGSASRAQRISYDGLAKLIYEAGGTTEIGE